MAQIVPRLNLNKTPQLVDNNSIIFAKNIRVNKDGTINKDAGVLPIDWKGLAGLQGDWRIVGTIPYNNLFYLIVYNGNESRILEYDERKEKQGGLPVSVVPCSYTYHGGNVDGIVTPNLNGDKILTIAEDTEGVPLKHINIACCKATDDESIYTQNPKVPIKNLLFNSYYINTIPNGIYQFFIRYEIYKDFYTDWLPCSTQLFSGTSKSTNVAQGTLRYIDEHINSNKSFIFDVETVYNTSIPYKSFQIGFILSSDDSIVCRSWKKFDINTTKIYFDYDEEFIAEVNIDDMLKAIYGLSKVGNVASYKNKLYVSNYTETDFNDNNLVDISNNITVGIASQQLEEIDKHYVERFDGKELRKSNKGNYIAVGNDSLIDEESLPKLHIKYTSNESYDYNYQLYAIKGSNYFNQQITNEFKKASNGNVVLSQGVSGIWMNEAGIFVRAKYYDLKYFPYGSYNKLGQDNAAGSYKTPFRFFGLRLDSIEFGSEKTEYSTNNINTWIHLDTDYERSTNVSNFITIEGINSYILSRIIGYDPEYGYPVLDTGEVLTGEGGKQIKINYTFFGSEFQRQVGNSDTYDFCVNEYTGNIDLSVYFNINNITLLYTGNQEHIEDTETLIPGKYYKFYVHYVTPNGEITSGYPVNHGNPVAIETFPNQVTRYYPTFANINIPNGYEACFFSIYPYKNNIATIFNIEEAGDKVVGDCMDIDTMLLPVLKNISINAPGSNINNSVTNDAYYHNSGESNNDGPIFFGCSGKVVIPNGNANTSKYYIKVNSEKASDINNIALVKCTPYIKKGNTSFNSGQNITLLGYICDVVKIRSMFDRYYNGTDVYRKDKTNYSFELENITTPVPTLNSIPHRIYSEYNLNYLSLGIDLSSAIRTYSPSNTEVKKQMYRAVDSLTASSTYKLHSMYYKTTRKVFSIYDSEALTRFDNTIRASEILPEEGRSYIYRFNALEYYNAPTDKGKIVNIDSAADSILVHCEDSIFKFTGSNGISSTEGGEVKLTEQNPFSFGINEVFGSEHGYAGLNSKKHKILTANSYIFFEHDSGHIYSYTGNGQIEIISEPIEKLLQALKNYNIRFADAFDRFFITIGTPVEGCVNISYNYKTKSFASLHDFTYDTAFNTKTRTYFINNNNTELYVMSLDSSSYHGLTIAQENNIYPAILDGNDRKAIIDVIFNTEYELVKALDSISWVCSEIREFTPKWITDNSIDLNLGRMAEEDQEKRFAGNYIQLYTDLCNSGNIYLEKVSNDSNITKDGNKSSIDPNSYRLPRYNCGVWSLNYYRDKLTEGDVNYTGYSDNHSLMYGKYIVGRFIFDNGVNFKLENVTFKVSRYDKS